MVPRNMLTKQGTPCKCCMAGRRCPLFPHAGPDEACEPAGPPVIPPALLEGLRQAQIEGGANAAADAAAATAAARAGTVRLMFDPIQAFSFNPFQMLRQIVRWSWAGSAARAGLAPCTRPPTAAAAAPPRSSGGGKQQWAACGRAACGWAAESSVWQTCTSVPARQAHVKACVAHLCHPGCSSSLPPPSRVLTGSSPPCAAT